MSLSTPTLYLNTSSLQEGDTNPFLAGIGAATNAPPWSRVSGATGPLLVVLCVVAEGIATAATLTEGNTLHYIAKADPADADLAVEIDFTETADGYQADSANLAVPVAVWTGGKTAVTLAGNFEERNAGGDVLRIWQANLALTRGVGDGGSPVIPSFVKYTVQTLTDPQKAQARANIGVSSSDGTVSDDGTLTVLNAGKALTVTGLNEIGALSLPPVIGDFTTADEDRVLIADGGLNQRAIASYTFTSSSTGSTFVFRNGNGEIDLSGLSIPFTASRGGVRLGTSTTDGRSQEWLNGAGTVAGYFDVDGAFVLTGGNGFDADGNMIANSVASTSATSNWGSYSLQVTGNASLSGTNTGDQTNVSGNAGTATKLLTARNVFGQSFDGSADITGGTGVNTALGIAVNATGGLVTTNGTATLTNKTLTDPAFTTPRVTQRALGLGRTTVIGLDVAGGAHWVSATISGTVSNNSATNGIRFVDINGGITGFGRAVYTTSTFSSLFSSAQGTIDFGSSWRLDFRTLNRVGTATTSRTTLLVGCTTTPTAHALSAKGISVNWQGDGSSGANLFISVHNGTTTTSSSNYAHGANNGSCYDYSLEWVAGTGLYLYRDGTLICQVTTGLPTGATASGSSNIAVLSENAGNATASNHYTSGMMVTRF